MRKRRLGVMLGAFAIGGAWFGLGCASDDPVNPGQGLVGNPTGGNGNGNGGSPTGGGGNGGSPTGGGGNGGSPTGGENGNGGTVATDDTPPRPECPNLTAPTEGVGAEKGACCYRGVANSKRLAAAQSGLVDLEFRLNFDEPVDHKATISSALILALSNPRRHNNEQAMLIRIQVPVENGQIVAGKGTFAMGPGRYNCPEGTYSFFGDAAAPVRANFPGADDPSRWLPGYFEDVDINPDDRSIDFAPVDPTLVGRKYLPFIEQGDPEWPLDFEIVGQDTSILDVDWSDLDCVGTYDEFDGWQPRGHWISFTTLADNYTAPGPGVQIDNTIALLSDIQFGQLIAFGPDGGVLFSDDGAALNPLAQPRCQPDNLETCPWAKLPDSLCPEDGDERFHCHIGYDNPLNEAAPAPNCSPDDPVASETSDGQCCDPLAQSATLPACNAYVIVNQFAAASAEITDEPSNEPMEPCPAE